MDKREARREFKAKKTPKGIFAVRCEASGETWVAASTHLDSQQTGWWFQLQSGMHPNRQMQAAWNTHGEASFTYRILETFDEDVAPLLLKDLSANRRKHWERELGVVQADSSRA